MGDLAGTEEDDMFRMNHGLQAAAGALLAAVCLLASVRNAAAGGLASLHWTLAVGATAQPSADLQFDALGLDFGGALNVALGSRYSLDEQLDVTVDLQIDEATSKPRGYEDAELTLSNSFIGPGLRYYPTKSSLRPFVQANVYYVSEMIVLEQFGDRKWKSRSGAGLGLAGGLELRATHRFSFPVTVQCLVAKPADNISGIGFNVGVTYNFRSPVR
jgi:hypothetical protein